MNELYESHMCLPVCDWPKESPYPSLRKKPTVTHRLVGFPPDFPAEELVRLDKEIPESSLPYSELNGYNRERRTREVKTLVLENNRLKATFVPSLGGKLWSLWDKRTGRELLYVNGVIQFGRLAIRNAWTSGGIEWNIGYPGHSPFTGSDVFAARVMRDDGCPVLRFYEWERIREMYFQVDCFLENDDSEFLFAAVRIENLSGRDTFTYWWNNIALPETPQTRVLAPTEWAITHPDVVKLVRHTAYEGVDASFPARLRDAHDFFYCIPQGNRIWEAAVDPEHGMISTSTGNLYGRKLFQWGNGFGSRHWPDFLAAAEGRPYIEIQSGLARTQMECVPIAAGARLFFMDSFGPLEPDERMWTGTYGDAVQLAAQDLERRLPQSDFAAIAARAEASSGLAPEALLHTGSGWGALEKHFRAVADLPAFPERNPYPAETAGCNQEPWRRFLSGTLPEAAAIALPSWQISENWLALLRYAENACPEAHRNAWLQYQLALNEYHRNDYDGLRRRLENFEPPREAIVYFGCLTAALERATGTPAAELAVWRRICSGAVVPEPVLLQAAPAFIAGGASEELLTLIPAAPGGRLKLIWIKAQLTLNRLEPVVEAFAVPFEVPDLGEGELAFSDLWFELRTRQEALREGHTWDNAYHRIVRERFAGELPRWMDFRMTAIENKYDVR